jgi:hypothetical protein
MLLLSGVVLLSVAVVLIVLVFVLSPPFLTAGL